MYENEEQNIARGRTIVDTVIVYSTEHNDIGNPVVRKVWINTSDIKSIYDAIQEVETITTGKEEDDLPF